MTNLNYLREVGVVYPIIRQAIPLLIIFTLFAYPASGSTGVDSSKVMRISDILVDVNRDGKLDLRGEKVTLAGRATVSSSVLHDRYLVIYVQDQSAGILVFSDTLRESISRGDSLVVTGTLELYYGKPEIVVDSYKIIDADPRIPSPIPLDSTYVNPERYQGMLVQGEAFVTGKSRPDGNVKLNISPSDTSDHSLSVFISRSHTLVGDFNFEKLSIGDHINVKGIMDKFVFDNSETFYQVLPRNPEDVTYAGIPQFYLNIFLWGGGMLSLLIFGWTILLKKQVKSKTKKLSKALEDKELLMKEIHHRVKNNLAIVSGLIELQLHSTDNPEAQHLLKDSNSRIQSMTLIHDKLYKTDSFTSVRLDIYLKELIVAIHETFTEQRESVDLVFELDPLVIDVNQVVPCGLLVNELVINAFKHAFNNKGHGQNTLEIILQQDNDQAILTVADNGPGLPGDFTTGSSESLGSMLISSFSAQLEAEMEIDNSDQGVAFSFRFPMR